MKEINTKYENLQKEFLNKLEELEGTPLSSINNISKIIYNDMMNLGNQMLQTWIDSKTEAENKSKKN